MRQNKYCTIDPVTFDTLTIKENAFDVFGKPVQSPFQNI